MGYYRQEYEDYYRGMQRNARNNNTFNTRNNTFKGRKEKKKNHLVDILSMLGIQIIGIMALAGVLYTFKIAKNEEFSKVYYLAKEIVKEDYYFKKNNIFDFKQLGIGESIGKEEGKINEPLKDSEMVNSLESSLDIAMPFIGTVSKNQDKTVTIKGGREVFSSLDGKVTYKNENKIIINHGNMVESIYENVEDVQVKKGDTLEKNQLIGMNSKKDSTIKFGVLVKGKFIDVMEKMK